MAVRWLRGGRPGTGAVEGVEHLDQLGQVGGHLAELDPGADVSPAAQVDGVAFRLEPVERLGQVAEQGGGEPLFEQGFLAVVASPSMVRAADPIDGIPG